MNESFDILMQYFRNKNWPVQQHDTEQILRFEYTGDNGKWYCYAQIREEVDHLLFLSVFTIKSPTNKRIPLSEYFTRANFALDIGHFEMDFDDGEIRYKTSIDVSNERLTFGLIDPLIKASFVAVDDHIESIESIINDDISAKDAYKATLKRIADDDEYELFL